jgi:hypothetical protein
VSLSVTIQLAIAPVFLLTGIGAFLSVMTTRLGRVIDRARQLESSITAEERATADPTDSNLPGPNLAGTDPAAAARRAITIADLAVLDRRMLLANRAVALSVASALTVCLLIALLFLDAVTPLHPDALIPALFILAISLLIASLTAFALEVRISIRTVRVRADLLRAPPAES